MGVFQKFTRGGVSKDDPWGCFRKMTVGPCFKRRNDHLKTRARPTVCMHCIANWVSNHTDMLELSRCIAGLRSERRLSCQVPLIRDFDSLV
eukprot:COSAG02_NODE_29_length_51136_cov_346.293317_12_plen_91_part_00